MSYLQIYDGDVVVFPLRRGVLKLRTRCCDCALVHDYVFKVRGNEIHRTATRNVRATADARRRTPKRRLGAKR